MTVKKYLYAIKTAVEISTDHNVPPIKGRTVIVFTYSKDLDEANKLVKSLPTDMQKVTFIVVFVQSIHSAHFLLFFLISYSKRQFLFLLSLQCLFQGQPLISNHPVVLASPPQIWLQFGL